MKNQYIGGSSLKKEWLWQVADLRGVGLGKKEEGGVFKGWGVDTPMHNMQSTYEK